MENTVENINVGDLVVHPENPRVGDTKAIARSIQANGWWGTLVVQVSTRRVLAGNHRLLAAKELGLETVPVYWVDVDDDHALRILLADNRTSDLGDYDDSLLAELLADFAGDEQGLLDIGFEFGYVEDLLRDVDGRDNGALDPYEEWANMPDYEQDNKLSAFQVVVHFPTEKDADDFFKRIGRVKKASMWWPSEDGHVGSSLKKAYVSEEE